MWTSEAEQLALVRLEGSERKVIVDLGSLGIVLVDEEDDVVQEVIRRIVLAGVGVIDRAEWDALAPE